MTRTTVIELAALGGAAVALLAAFALLRRRRLRAAGFDEDVEPVRPEHELSPVIERLIAQPALAPARLAVPPRAELPGRLPGPGVHDVGGVDLPAGRPTRRVRDADVALAVREEDPTAGSEQLWVARTAGRGVGAAWKRFAAAFPQTGLWPVLLPTASDPDDRTPWYDEHAQRHRTEVGSVADRLRSRLADSLSGGSPLSSTARLSATGVARGELGRGGGRRTDALAAAFEQLGEARLALAPARRPGDVLHAVAWPGAERADVPTSELADLLASWEERYGALLVGLDAASVVLAVLCPPVDERSALELLAEHHALCPDEAHDWGDESAGARALVDAPVWRLSWR